MKILKLSLLNLIFLGLLVNVGYSQQKSDEWNTNNPPGKFKEFDIEVDEGTWMNLDVSPDGKDIVFDLLGDIYSMPITGGQAKLLRGGLAWEVQPRFSPDGKYILFTSDFNGADNIWYMKRDGSDPIQITKEDFRLLNNAVWTPDGEFIIARKHFTAERSAGAGEMWMYHKTGGAGIKLTKRKNEQQDVNEPSISPDGRFVYFSEDMYPGGSFQYNKDPNSQIYVIKRYDRETGDIETIIGGGGGAFRPQISPDGKKLAFVRRVRTKTVLFVRELETGLQYPVFENLSKDQQEAWALFGVYPGFNWMPNGNEVVIWANGKINKVNINDNSSSVIPFKAKAKHKIYDAVLFPQEVSPNEFNSKAIRNAVTSPSGKQLVFNAAGYLWIKELPNGTPVRLTNSTYFEFEPTFSNDGSKMAYVSWDDEEKGKIGIIDFTTLNLPKSMQYLDLEKGIYRTPSFSNDGKMLVYIKESGNDHQGFDHCVQPGIYVYDFTKKSSKYIQREGEYPMFNVKNDRIFYQTGGYLFGSLNKGFHSVDLSGFDKRTHFTSKYTNRFVPSPDNKFIAFNELWNGYIAVFPESGQTIDLNANTKEVPVARITKDAGINLHWSEDSQKIHWTLGEEYFTNNLKDRFQFLNEGKKELPPIDSVGLSIGLKIKTDVPEGSLLLKNAKIITMNGDKILENNDILVVGNKISKIGANLNAPNAKIIDCSGKIIMPGLVDVHAHLGTFRHGISPKKHWQYWANLAYGVTTTHDPSSNTEMVFSQSEMIKAGNMVGPRVYSTGAILYGADGDFKAVINNLEDAKSALRRTKAFGAFSVKSYNQPRRNQRQMVIEAARQLKMMVVPEGGSHFFHNLTMVLDGHTGVEHNIPVAPLNKDVQELWSKSKTANTPTLVVSYGAVSGEYYWYQKTNVWEKERLLRFTPRAIVDSRARHRTMIPDEEYENGHILVSKSLKALSDKGVKINMGAHGQLQGLGAHWEMWMLKQGGMTEMEVLKASTINGAQYLGMDKEIGSIEEGKLADLIILDKDPLQDIYNTESIKYTIMNGRIFDAETMKEIGNYENKTERDKFWWENLKYNDNFDWHEETNSFEQIRCSCGH